MFDWTVTGQAATLPGNAVELGSKLGKSAIHNISGPSTNQICSLCAIFSARRSVHVNALHEYHDVRADMCSARGRLGPGGIAAFDDYAAAHTSAGDGLRPVCLSADKLYGTSDDPAVFQEQLLDVLATAGEFSVTTHRGLGLRVIRIIRRQAGTTRAD